MTVLQASAPSRQPSEPENKDIKWTTLEHAGVLFPPEYTRLPDSVKLLYEGQPVELTAEQVRAFEHCLRHCKAMSTACWTAVDNI